jgi:hypothetical protein
MMGDVGRYARSNVIRGIAVPVRFEFTPTGSDGGLSLVIHADPSPDGRTYARVAAYRLELVRTETGRAFLLHRDAADIAADGPDADELYMVVLAPNGVNLCSCPEFEANDECDHLDTLLAAAAAGLLDTPAITSES